MKKLSNTQIVIGLVTTVALAVVAYMARQSGMEGIAMTVPPKASPTRTTAARTRTPLWTPSPTLPPSSPVFSATPSATRLGVASATAGATRTPWPGAPACTHSSNDTFHTLWDASRGCHHDHEHGQNPFTSEVLNTFPGFDLKALLGGVEIGHTNPSGPMENTMKHGGFKWDVALSIPCEVFEGADSCVTAAAIQYHAFGNAAIEFNARVHSALAVIKACRPSNPSDCGYLYTVQHVDYGQRVSQYQGDVVPYTVENGCLTTTDSMTSCAANPLPIYAARLGPYNTVDRFGNCVGCRPSLEYVVSRNANANGVWTSKNGPGVGPIGSSLLAILFRIRDMYQLLDWSAVQAAQAEGLSPYPFKFGWVCSSDGGATYRPSACRYNNTTTRVHEVAGVVPSAWDNLAGFDTNPAPGRITAEGYTTRFGILNPVCTAPAPDCHPIKMVNMFVGKYGGQLPGAKVSNPSPESNPERDIYFCGGRLCAETSAGAVPSGWVGTDN